ncbi:hypothetical protein TRFO_24897 [Tritrichomonas foetus]|uniref:Peptidase M60 domain-containing protein n=1 Tax=Tritrichomonas foetus TaxID=1144522 RepID=A0A1J4K7F9_9EUKA|nr:hypothetical protein TRFO_24897 [Tritrichomonas foetus]|eukprot:OHT06938.1 hypothetical protein TRFO_24897 [Tritrichomonas foetus]
MLFLSLFLHLLSCADDSQKNYVRSIFGHPGTDEVDADLVHGFEVLQRGLSKPTTTLLPEGRFTTDKIKAEDYPYPGKQFNRTCTWQNLQNETAAIVAFYARANVQQSELYRHPVAAQQYYSTDEELNKADRVKARYVSAPKYNRYTPPVFLPPGEVVTIEFPNPDSVGKVNVMINLFTYYVGENNGEPKSKTRIPNLRINPFPLNSTKNTIGSPYGGVLEFSVSGDYPVEMIISGVILCPYFKYGVHSDEEWENEQSKLPGPMATLDTGNMLIVVPSKYVRDVKRMNDCMLFYRSAYQISQSTARDSYAPNSNFNRPLNILRMNFDSYVPAGAAVAFVGGNFCHFPPDWINSMVRWDSLQDNPWGIVHEMNHHHQGNWAKTQESGEMSNNALNLVIYAQSNQASSPRNEEGGLRDWSAYTTLFQKINDDESYGLARYSTMLHYFGLEKFKEFVRADQDDKYYPRSKYGNAGAEMLRASKIFNTNMRYHWNFHGTNDSVLFSGNETMKALEELNVEDFHPVSNAYGCGFIRDDNIGFLTTRPYQISPMKVQLDFNRTMRQRVNTEWFGDFEFTKITTEDGREDAWVEVGYGKYELTPKENVTEIEEVIAYYKDKTTKKTTRIICQFVQNNYVSYFERYENISDYQTVFDAYRAILNGNETVTYTSNTHKSVNSPNYKSPDSSAWISITKGMIKPTETSDNYVFATQADEMALFYLSENPLSNDPDLDEPLLINYQNGYNSDYTNGNHSNPVSLTAGKYYYFILVMYNKAGQGGGSMGYRIRDSDNFVIIPKEWIRCKPVDDKEIFDRQYRPDFEKIYLLDKYDGSRFFAQEMSTWNVYKHPKGDVIVRSNDFQGYKDDTKKLTITDAWTDGDPTTEFRTKWWAGDQPIQQFPHIYEIDMGKTYTFSYIHIGKCGNPQLFDLEGEIEISVAPSNFTTVIGEGNESTTIPYSQDNYSIDHPEAIVFEGHYTSEQPIIKLSKEQSGRYMRITVYNNSKIWKDNNPGRTSISAVEVGSPINSEKVYPLTNTKLFELEGFTETRAGVYYNGKGFTGKKGSKLTITLPKGRSEIGILGDYHSGIGTATVKINKKDSGTIHDSIEKAIDQRKLKYSTRAYKSLLYFNTLNPEKENKITVEITDGEITLAGIITDEEVYTYQSDPSRIKELNYNRKKGLSSGSIAAIVIVVLLVVSLVAVGIFLYIKRPPFIERLFHKEKNTSTLFNTV